MTKHCRGFRSSRTDSLSGARRDSSTFCTRWLRRLTPLVLVSFLLAPAALPTTADAAHRPHHGTHGQNEAVPYECVALKGQYGVLKCRPIAWKDERDDKKSPHFQVLGEVNGKEKYRLAINVLSTAKPKEVLVYTTDHFEHAMTEQLTKLPQGGTVLEKRPGGMALDYVRGGLFDHSQMKPLAADVGGPNNDLNDMLQAKIERAMKTNDAELYVFGTFWGPEDKPDGSFGFKPGAGIHLIHMNQGNRGQFAKDNGTWQDGGIMIHYPSENRWEATFLAFQSQSFDTDEQGNPRDKYVSSKGRIYQRPFPREHHHEVGSECPSSSTSMLQSFHRRLQRGHHPFAFEREARSSSLRSLLRN